MSKCNFLKCNYIRNTINKKRESIVKKEVKEDMIYVVKKNVLREVEEQLDLCNKCSVENNGNKSVQKTRNVVGSSYAVLFNCIRKDRNE